MKNGMTEKIIEYLRTYDGPSVRLMEVCGSHTSAIAKNGIPSILSDRITLLSGPGCPVCVTPTAYIDRLIALAKMENTCVVTFGDLLRVPGSIHSLQEEIPFGASVKMVYSPMEVFSLAKENPAITYIFAAIGFETTTPAYALLVKKAEEEQVENVRLLTAIKTMPAAIDWIASHAGKAIDGFIAPGHVAAVTGSDVFVPLAEKYNTPFAVAGFDAQSLLLAIYVLVKARHQGSVFNAYPEAVRQEEDPAVRKLVNQYFVTASASWRGMGEISDSGRLLREEYSRFDAGSKTLMQDAKRNKACRCDEVLVGNVRPSECPLFGKVCTPLKPQGACMVSEEGSCHTAFMNR